MLASSLASSPHADALQAPRWLLTNGYTTIGPVPTELLLRGYLGGRIPEHCQVRELSWSSWRPLDGIREIGGLRRRMAHGTASPSFHDAAQTLPVTRDAGELLALALQTAALALAADAGLVHRYRSPLALPVTSAAVGVPATCLGEVLPSHDPSYLRALSGMGLCGSPEHGVAERLVAQRLQPHGLLASVAMAPVIAGGRLVALLELGRADHAFRRGDGEDLAEFAAQVARRIG